MDLSENNEGAWTPETETEQKLHIQYNKNGKSFEELLEEVFKIMVNKNV